MSYYLISLEELKYKVTKRRRNNFLKYEKQFTGNKSSNVKKITNEFGERLVRVDGEIPVNINIKKGQRFLFISYEQSRYTHGLHKYPAKFFPELPRWLIKRYSKKNDIILDPFSGSATTNVESLLCSRNSVGIDVDPFSKFLARVKTTPLPINELEESAELLLQKIENFKPSLVSEKDIPDFPYRNNWFQKEILLELAYIRKKINTLEVNKEIESFFKVCFSSIIRAVSNADNNCTRTVVRKKLNKNIYPSMALTKFIEAVILNVPRMAAFSKVCPKDKFAEFPDDNDARYLTYEDNYFDLAVTSPPYVNAVDYPRTHQLEIYWLGFTNGSLTPLKRMHVGTESVKTQDYKELHKIGIKEADQKIRNIFIKDSRRAFIAYKYLKDMHMNLKEVFRVLKKGKRYIVVVGNNKIRGEIFESWRYLMKMAEKTGFKVETYFGSEIINHFIKVPREERINTDWVIVLRK